MTAAMRTADQRPSVMSMGSAHHPSEPAGVNVAEKLGSILTGFPTGKIPPQARQHAAMLIASTLSSAALGFDLDSSRIVRELSIADGGRQQSTVWFASKRHPGGARLPAAEAARVNALTSDAAASDDSDLRNMMHCGTPLVAAALALSEAMSSSEEETLAAIVLGYEAAGRINRCIPNFRKRNFHGSSVVIFGVTAAAGLLLKLNTDQMANALGIAASSIGTLSKASDTSTMREHNSGQATFNGVRAALTARAGFTAETMVFTMRGGFFETFGGVADGRAAAEGFLAGFGEAWDIDRFMAIKLVPGGHPYHALAEATADILADRKLHWRDIAKITYSRCDGRYMDGPLHPTDLIGMAHSPTYFLAAGAVDGGMTWDHVRPEKIVDADIHEVIDIIEPDHTPSGKPEDYQLGANVTVVTKDNSTFATTVLAPRGSTKRGIDWEMLDVKYRALMPFSMPDQEKVAASFARIRSMPDSGNVAELHRYLV